MNTKRKYHLSIRCFYNKTTHTQHNQIMPLKDIPKWLEAYIFTHPTVQRISVNVWPQDKEE